MARFRDREKALALRKEGKSYSQIKKILNVSKSTLSNWLKEYPLSKERIRVLRDVNEQRIERYRETMRKKREGRWEQYYQKQKSIIFPITSRDLYIAGLFLYWGEGLKRMDAKLSVSNTDPSVIFFFMEWCMKSLQVPPEKFRVYLHIYQDMDAQKEMQYWSRTLALPKSQFGKPYIKKTTQSGISHKGSFGHGTCNVSVGGARMAEEVLMGIKALADAYKMGV